MLKLKLCPRHTGTRPKTAGLTKAQHEININYFELLCKAALLKTKSKISEHDLLKARRSLLLLCSLVLLCCLLDAVTASWQHRTIITFDERFWHGSRHCPPPYFHLQ